MHAYRASSGASSDEETAALADLAERVRSLKLRLGLPLLVLVLVFAIAASLFHAIGEWALFGRASDGSYLIGVPSLAVALALGASVVAIPGYALHRLALRRLIERWKAEARARYGLDDDTLSSFASMFEPRPLPPLVESSFDR